MFKTNTTQLQKILNKSNCCASNIMSEEEMKEAFPEHSFTNALLNDTPVFVKLILSKLEFKVKRSFYNPSLSIPK